MNCVQKRIKKIHQKPKKKCSAKMSCVMRVSGIRIYNGKEKKKLFICLTLH